MQITSGVSTFNAAGVTFCEIPEGDAMIGDRELNQKPEYHYVKKFALAQKPGTNSQLDYYSSSMGDLTHGRVARRKVDGRPFVVERTRADGSGKTPGAGVIAFDESSSVLVSDGALVRLVPDPVRYVTRLSDGAAHFIGPHLPATLVTGFEALGWADFLARESGVDVTLPTSIQWQYAAQGGRDCRYAAPNKTVLVGSQVICQIGARRRYGPASLNREGWQQLLNPFGLLDMTGNVEEPTLIEKDITQENLECLRESRFISWHGGSWNSDDEYHLMVAHGSINSPHSSFGSVGVRVCVVFS